MNRYDHTTSRRRSPLCGALLLLIAAAAVLTSACGTSTWRPSALRPFEMDPEFEITDTDIEKAYEARPQLPDAANVAYYTWDTRHTDEIQSMIEGLPGVEGVYGIPPFLVTGEHRYDPQHVRRYGQQAKPLSLKKLRMLAARAHADVLVVVDYGYRQETSANGLAALNVLVLPTLFTPFLDVRVESFLDAYAIDVRNGYLYGHVSSSQSGDEEWVTIYETEEHPMIEEHLPILLEDSGEALAGVIEESRQETTASRGPKEPAEGDPAPPEADR